MRLALAGCASILAAAWILPAPGRISQHAAGEAAIRSGLKARTGVLLLPPGTIEVSVEFVIPRGAHDLEIRGAAGGTTLRAADRFSGRAIFRCDSATRIRFANFTVDGNRQTLETRAGLPGYDVPFASFTSRNGILASNVAGLTVAQVRFVNVAGFAVLASRSRDVRIDGVRIENSGSRNAAGRNNTTGGILLEEGTANFQVLDCDLRNVRGNGIWTHSLYTSPRNADGQIAGNRFHRIGRDAVQVGHATNIRVEDNSGSYIGYPVEDVDIEGLAIPVAIDTAGNTDRSAYDRNRFEEINGKCMDLDGFHQGQVRGNSCVNRQAAERYPHGHYGIVMNNSNPDMRSEQIDITENEIDGALFGGIFVIGRNHKVTHNRLRRLNLAHCNENAAGFGCYYAPAQPDLLRSGIYLGSGAERPAAARNNVIEDNVISGYRMRTRCIAAAPGVSLQENRIARNTCSDDPE